MLIEMDVEGIVKTKIKHCMVKVTFDLKEKMSNKVGIQKPYLSKTCTVHIPKLD